MCNIFEKSLKKSSLASILELGTASYYSSNFNPLSKNFSLFPNDVVELLKLDLMYPQVEG